MDRQIDKEIDLLFYLFMSFLVCWFVGLICLYVCLFVCCVDWLLDCCFVGFVGLLVVDGLMGCRFVRLLVCKFVG